MQLVMPRYLGVREDRPTTDDNALRILDETDKN
jgi:hypothetical protein